MTLRRVVVHLAVLVAVLPTAGCTTSGPAPNLLDALPRTLLDRGATWVSQAPPPALARGPLRTLSVLGLDPSATQQMAWTGAPRVLLAAHPDAPAAAATLADLGYAQADGPARWEVWQRTGPPDRRTVGLPAVALGEGPTGPLLVTGSVAEVADVLAAVDALDADSGVFAAAFASEPLSEAVLAIVGTPAAAASAAQGDGPGPLDQVDLPVPAYEWVALASTGWSGDHGEGVVAVHLAAEAGQDDAVALASRVRTATLRDGRTASEVVEIGGPLPSERLVALPLTWRAPWPETLAMGPDAPLLGALAP